MLRDFTCLLILFLCPDIACAYDSRYEERIAKQLVEGKSQEEVVRLTAGGSEFVALYMNHSTEKALGAVILIHAMGAHPDWPDVVSPLRTSFPEHGWATLAIQMPVISPLEPIANYGKTMKAAKQRIDAAVEQLRDWRFSNIVIIGHSFGAATAAYALSSNDIENVNAFIGISMQAQAFLNPRVKLLRDLETISIPVLDIYGSRDKLEVIREVDDRRLAGRKKGNTAYKQMVIEGADHYFTGLIDVLIKRMKGWLVKASPGEGKMSEE